MTLVLSRSVNDYITTPGRFNANQAVVLCGQKFVHAVSNKTVAFLAFTVDLSAEDICYDMINLFYSLPANVSLVGLVTIESLDNELIQSTFAELCEAQKSSRDYFLVRYDKDSYTAQQIAVAFSKKKKEQSKGIDATVVVNDDVEKDMLSIRTFVPLFLLGRGSENGFDINGFDDSIKDLKNRLLHPSAVRIQNECISVESGKSLKNFISQHQIGVLNHLDLFYPQISEMHQKYEKPQLLTGSCCAFGVVEAETAIRDVVSALTQDGVRTIENRMEQLCDKMETKATDGKMFLWRVIFSIKEFPNVYLSQSYLKNTEDYKTIINEFCEQYQITPDVVCLEEDNDKAEVVSSVKKIPENVSNTKLTAKNSKKRNNSEDAVVSKEVVDEPKQPFYTTKVYIILCVVLFLAGGISSLLMHLFGGEPNNKKT